MVKFTYNGVTYHMTEEEIEAAYRYQERKYRLDDARCQLNLLVFGYDIGEDTEDPEYNEDKSYFLQNYGISYEEASSERMLDKYLRRFWNRFECNYDENSQWEAAIHSVLDDAKKHP